MHIEIASAIQSIFFFFCLLCGRKIDKKIKRKMRQIKSKRKRNENNQPTRRMKSNCVPYLMIFVFVFMTSAFFGDMITETRNKKKEKK